MEKTQTPLLPRLSRVLGKTLANTGIGVKDAAIAGAKGSARIAGQCAREFLEGLKEGKNPGSEPQCLKELDANLRGLRHGMFRGDTDGDLEQRMDARKAQ